MGGFDSEPPMNYKSPQFNRDYAVWAAGRRPRRLSIYLTELTVHGGSELTGGRLTAMWSAVLVGGGRAASQMPKPFHNIALS